MKKSSIIICLSILGYIFSISSTYNTLIDCEYGKECVVSMESFSGGYIPESTKLYFRIPINTKNTNAITIKLLKDEDYPSSLDVYFYSKKPTDEEAMSGRGSSDWVHEDDKEKENKYTKYIYPIDEDYSGEYIVVSFYTYDDYHYFSILLSSYKKKTYYIGEIEYNKEHEIENIDDYKTNFQFWLKTENNDNEFIRIKLHKDDSNSASEIMIQLAGLKINPLEMRDNTDIIDQRIFLRYDSKKADGDYILYYYAYSKLKVGVKYLFLSVVNEYRLKYFSIGIGNKIYDDSGKIDDGSNIDDGSDIDDGENNNNNVGYLKLKHLKYASFILFLWLL